MANIRIFSTKKDDYLDEFLTQSKLMGLRVQAYRYENFSFHDNQLTYKGRKSFPQFTAGDVSLFRRCDYEKTKQHFWLRLLATLARDAGACVLNQDMMVNFPLHSGKLFQAAYFSAYGVPHIATYRLSRKISQLEFPVIAKKRYSAFGKDTHLAHNQKELEKLKQKIKGLDNYVIQPFLVLRRDVRVMILDSKVLGSVSRKVRITEEKQVRVKVGGPTSLTKQEKRVVQKVLETFELDLAGLDIFTSLSGKVWVGEINFFPNFAGYNHSTGQNIHQQVLALMQARFKLSAGT